MFKLLSKILLAGVHKELDGLYDRIAALSLELKVSRERNEAHTHSAIIQLEKYVRDYHKDLYDLLHMQATTIVSMQVQIKALENENRRSDEESQREQREDRGPAEENLAVLR